MLPFGTVFGRRFGEQFGLTSNRPAAGGGVPAPVASFTWVDNGNQTVTFTDTSTETPTSWDWDFGDGSEHGTTQNPTHTYADDGPFTVIMTATNAGGSDQASDTVAVQLVFSDNFNAADGAIGNNWTGATWTIATNKATNTPTLGSELLANPGFTDWTTDNPNSWTVLGESGSDPEVTERDPNQGHADTKTTGGAANMFTSSALIRLQQAVLTADAWYRLAVNITNKVGSANGQLKDNGAGIFYTAAATGTKIATGKASNTAFELRSNFQPCNLTFDDASAKALTLSELFVKQELVRVPTVMRVKGTRIANTGGHNAWGVALYVDDNNFLLIYETENSALRLLKRVGGTYTSVATASITYSAGAELEMDYDPSAKTVVVKYNGSTTTINGTSVTDNVFTTADIVALFSTDTNVTFDDLVTNAAPVTPGGADRYVVP